jgi:membrane peptidoglycan carboxypeptidase
MIGLVFSLILVGGALAGLGLYASLVKGLPSLEKIPALLEPPTGTWLQPTRLYDRSGVHILAELQDPAAEGWQYLTVSEDGGSDSFSEALILATLAANDPTFWENPGYLMEGWQQGTHPTLAQRLVLDILLSEEAPSWRRNLRERLLAGQLVSRYGREKVLEWYLNSTRYGPLIYGADAAARVYFDKSASELSVAEAAWLVAAAETPSIKLNQAWQGGSQRQEQVVAQMLIQGWISAEEARQATEEEVVFRSPLLPETDLMAFTSFVIDQLSTHIPRGMIERGGLRIITTLNYDLQLQAACTLKTQLLRLHGLREEVLTSDSSICAAARLLPAVDFQEVDLPGELSGNMVIIDPASGQILAYIGQAGAGLNPAQQPGHAGGTLLTPFVYLAAFVRGFSPASLVWDVPEAVQVSGSIDNPGSGFTLGGYHLEYHGPVRLRTALVNDYLGASAQLYARLGADNTWQTARRFGMNSLATYQPWSASFVDLMNAPVTLLETLQAYSVFANLGTQAGQFLSLSEDENDLTTLLPGGVMRVEDDHGQVLLNWEVPQTRSIISPQLAYLMTDVLSDEVSRWPSLGHPNPLEIGRPAMARVGFSLDGSQAWTVGFVPQVGVGVWLGSLDGSVGKPPTSAAAGVWNALIKYYTLDMPVQSWDTPIGITRLSVCDPSGYLPTNACPRVVSEVFLQGAEPTQEDNLYQVMMVNRETGLLATVFTPPELVEARVFLAVPAWATAWAEHAGLPVPPSGYDPIYVAQTGSTATNMSSPAMFDHVRGQVSIRGTAGGDNFAYYRLQVGQGLYPESWFLIGTDVAEPVEDGVLGVWDTEGLQGLYVVQLMVVYTDQRIDRALLQVTVDNSPPEVNIIDPAEGQQFSLAGTANLLLQAQAIDNLVVERLEFYIDGALLYTYWQPPYAGLWPARPGEHTLLVRAYDLAGNTSEQVVSFSIIP